MERLFKSGVVTSIIGAGIIVTAVVLYVSKGHSETEAGAVAALGLMFLRSKDSLIGVPPKK